MSMLRVFGPSRAVLPAGGAQASAAAAAALTAQVRLATQAVASAAAQAALSVPKPLGATAGASALASGSLTTSSQAPSGAITTFTSLPSLADERATYDLLGWARTAGDESFDFIDLGPIGMAIHDDSEADDLWTWDAQVRRGYTAPIATTFRDRWLTYYRGGTYRTALPTVDGDQNPPTAADPMCHTYGWGLVRYGVLTGDSTAIAEAEAIADIALTQVFGGTTSASYPAASGYNMGWGGGRNRARPAILVAWLAYATGKAKWIGWLDALIDAYLGASTYSEVTIGGQVRGAYFCDRDWMNTNGQGGVAAYDAGRRSNTAYQYALHAEFLWRAYLLTARADVRDRIIRFARFMEYYAHDPAMTAQGGPFCGSFFGREGTSYWHRDNPGDAHYDASIVNLLVWGHKLTGDAALLTRARTHLRQGTRWAEGEPGGTGAAPLVPANEVADFIDTRRNTGGSIFFTDNKGQLQYCYQVFENGGALPTLDSNVPSYIRNLAAGSALQIATRISNAFASFAGQSGDPMGVYAYSGGAYDTKRGRYMRSGGGHNDHNGNGVYGVSIYASETPAWELFKPHTSPPSVTDVNTQPAVETAPNGDPAASHTYNQIIYDAQNDKLVLMGLGAAAGSNGAAFPRIRALNLTTNTWDGLTSHPSKANAGQGAFACYDELARAVWCKEGQITLGLQRFDVVANTVSTVSDGLGTMNIDVAVALDPVRRYMIAIGGYNSFGPLDSGAADMLLWDLATYNGASVTAYSRTLTGFPAALRAAKLGLEFHPPSRSFVAWAGGNSIYRLIPPSNPFTGTWTFQTLTPSGTALPTVSIDSLGGVYSKFRWAPYPHDKSRGVFVMDCAQGTAGNYTASQLAIYKPSF